VKIALVSHSGGVGGAELCLVEAAKGLVQDGHEVHAIVPFSGPLLIKLQATGAYTSVVKYCWWVTSGTRSLSRARQLRRLLAHPASVLGLTRTLRSWSPDVILTNTIAFPGAAVAARLLRRPHVWYIHEFDADEHGLTFDYGRHFSLRVMNQVSDAVLMSSQAVLNNYEEFFSGAKSRVIDPAVEVSRWPSALPRGEAVFRLIMVGAVVPSKRQRDAIDAVKLLRDNGLDVCLTIVGPTVNGYDAILREYISDLRLGESVKIVPYADNPQAYVSVADLAITCSASEGFGRVTIEAMKSGKPVVGAAGAATSELISDGQTGYLYRAGDVRDLARKIAALYSDPDLLAAMGQRAYSWATERFTLSRYASQLEATFNEVVRA
jgi:glycosyltransferase involved in cell wall biosynthesis